MPLETTTRVLLLQHPRRPRGLRELVVRLHGAAGQPDLLRDLHLQAMDARLLLVAGQALECMSQSLGCQMVLNDLIKICSGVLHR